ncbi:MAG: transglutaminase-like cysteine peptidase [Beijerinckiaceae bacterium]|nr:transglutaminase-like cysteine peptidase [Beijerinckiaceae bacterium]
MIALGIAGTGAAGDDIARVSAHQVRTASLPSEAMSMAPPFNSEGGRAKAPMGWTAFCQRYTGECSRDDFVAEPIVLEGAAKDLILRVNAAVNGAITPATDMLQWGVEERWDFAETGVGDCEDYVLLKQRWLVSAGLPRAALLVTVVTDLAGDGHAVLTVHTDRGDYILDNMNDDVKLWRETTYSFVKRQSRFVSDEWVSLNGGGAAPAMVSR